MFILKLVGKILLLPVWLILFVIGLAVKMTVQTYTVVRGILGFIFTLLIIATAYCYHDWVQVILAFYKTYKPAIYILPVHSSGSGFSINSPFSEAVRWMEFLTA